MREKKSASILRKFLLFNLGVFSILGLFTLVYLKAIQPNLVKKRTADHHIIINNTIDHLQRLNINFNTKDINNSNFSCCCRLFSYELYNDSNTASDCKHL